MYICSMETIALVFGYIFVALEFIAIVIGGPICIIAFLIAIFCCITGKELPWRKKKKS